jgi:ATP-dependent exoDNAse (exonuclease V) alpha subunit
LAGRLQELGYEIERGEHGQPEIKGYTHEYLEASSPRRQQITKHLDELGLSGPKAAQIAAHKTRSAKLDLNREEVRAQHLAASTAYGSQPQQVITKAQQRQGVGLQPEQAQHDAQGAVKFASDRGMEREAVVDERALLRDALRHSMGTTRLPEIKAEFEQCVASRELIDVDRKAGLPGRAFTTPEMQRYEREIIEQMHLGQGNRAVLADGEAREKVQANHSHLSTSQRQAVAEVLENRDRMMALEGVAGGGKTTSLAAIQEAASSAGYEVKGLAPTSRAAQKLAEAGMETETLQRHLTRSDRTDDGRKRLFIVDESSMVSTKQMHTFIERLKENDRVLLVGDTRQHEAVEAGRPYAQLQETGLRTAHLDEIIRQKDPALRQVVEQLARGDVQEAVANISKQGRVHQILDRDERIAEIAHEYVRQPKDTLVVSPDNQSRQEINSRIHKAMQAAGLVKSEDHSVRVLNSRQDLTGADRMWAQNYELENVVRFAKNSKVHGFSAGEYVRVVRVDHTANVVTVERRGGEQVSYDPKRQQGVTVYREAKRIFAEGDRLQLTAPFYPEKLANRELGTLEKIDGDGNLALRMDDGRVVEFNARQHPHLDHGYAVTSHSSQGQTADRVLVHIDSEHIHKGLINERMAYVSISRARHDVQIFTNDTETLGRELGKEVSNSSALQPAELKQIVEIMNLFQREQAVGIGL